MQKATWEKILEYASSPLHGTLSRKQRKGVKLQINSGDLMEDAVLFLGDEFVRVTETKASEVTNVYYDWDKIISIKTVGPKE